MADNPSPTSSSKSERGRTSGMPWLERILWLIAGVCAITAVGVFVSTLIPPPASSVGTPPATRQAQIVEPTGTPSPMSVSKPTSTSTLAATAVPVANLSPLVIPTPPPGGVLLTLPADPNRTGWVSGKELGSHWGDRNLHSGVYLGEAIIGLAQFDLQSLPPGSKILFAALELTGRNAGYLGKDGIWNLDLIDAKLASQWDNPMYATVLRAPALTALDKPLTAKELSAGGTNRYILNSQQLALLEKQLDFGKVMFRIHGPSEGSDNLFTWDAGAGPSGPTLYVVSVPREFVVITNTPTAANVYAAATLAVQQTRQAQQFGTPTPFPRYFATATPGATGVVVVTSVPANQAVATAMSAYATAVAVTTGTFTPTPPYLVTPTATPPFITLDQFTPVPTWTPRPDYGRLTLAETPIPPEAGLKGNIVFLTDREGGDAQMYVMKPDGKVLGKLTGNAYKHVIESKDLFSPDLRFQVDVDRDSRDKWQVVLIDYLYRTITPLITEEKIYGGMGIYHPAWSPLSNKIAFVSDRFNNSGEIFVYDVATKSQDRLTKTNVEPLRGYAPYNKHPSWSPDGKQIVFFSDREGFPPHKQIFVMNADGTNLHVLSSSSFNDWDPIWVKW